ncbi:MAG: peptidase E [Myxococcota bacterium]|nr:peptidase E [Myxococcota bacterium]
MGGGGFSMEPENLALDQFILELAGVKRPRVCFVPTASGDSDLYIERFYECFGALPCKPSDLGLFRRTGHDLRERVLAQDIIYVGGGNTFNMLALWRAHGLDTLLRETYEQGTILCGLSAGSLCWYESGVTDSFGPLGELLDGLGFLSGSHCPHYDGEVNRKPTYERLVGEGVLPQGIAADDGVGLVYREGQLVEVVTSRPEAGAYRVTAESGLKVTPLPKRVLPAGHFVRESWPKASRS